MKLDPIVGTAWCYGDNINTDLICPGRYLTLTEPKELAKYAMAGLDLEFGENVKNGDIIIAGTNFGSGSSREQAALCLKFAGVGAVVAVSFARIFFRNAINQGILAFISPEAISTVKTGDKIELEVNRGYLKNLTSGKKCKFEPLPEFFYELIENGGIIPHLKKKLHN